MKISSSEYVKSVFNPADLPRESLPEIAFAGRSNVGKSSLINSLVKQRKLARTSSDPGKTRSIIFYRINNEFLFVDLPGYGYARVSRELREAWRPLVEGYFRNRKSLRAAVVILDIRRELSSGDRDLLDWLKTLKISTVIVLTKVDKLSRNQREKQQKLIGESLGVEKESLILFSGLTGEGRDRLWKRIMGEIRAI
ncbi:MAG: YihA family ribosome biogenesis GTP-binding protein [Deltaproteobacteria bacterium]|nr:MAG: YihA family ribosome biogenesis GTP-binding protein [Deltaproteobacteria bacterium]